MRFQWSPDDKRINYQLIYVSEWVVCWLSNLYALRLRCINWSLYSIYTSLCWINQSNMYNLKTSKTQLEFITYVCYINTKLTHTHTCIHIHTYYYLLLKRKIICLVSCCFSLVLFNIKIVHLFLTFFFVFYFVLSKLHTTHSVSHTDTHIHRHTFRHIKMSIFLKTII